MALIKARARLIGRYFSVHDIPFARNSGRTFGERGGKQEKRGTKGAGKIGKRVEGQSM